MEFEIISKYIAFEKYSLLLCKNITVIVQNSDASTNLMYTFWMKEF